MIHKANNSSGNGHSKQPRFLHIAKQQADPRVWHDAFLSALREIGEVKVIEHGENISEEKILEEVRQSTIYLSSWKSIRLPQALAENPGKLEYICHTNGTIKEFIPHEIMKSGIPVTNWGDAVAGDIAEGAVTLLLACLKDLPGRITHIQQGGWRDDAEYRGWTMDGLKLGVYGYGAIGRRFVEMVRPFNPKIMIFDPYAQDTPSFCSKADSLEDLFSWSSAVAIHAGLTDETRHSVNAELLALLPNHGVLINTSRGAIADQNALFAELRSGRLRMGLDVLDPDRLPRNHEARQWPNLILTAHDIGNPRPWPKTLHRLHRYCLDNIQRHLDGKPKKFKLDPAQYVLTT